MLAAVLFASMLLNGSFEYGGITPDNWTLQYISGPADQYTKRTNSDSKDGDWSVQMWQRPPGGPASVALLAQEDIAVQSCADMRFVLWAHRVSGTDQLICFVQYAPDDWAAAIVANKDGNDGGLEIPISAYRIGFSENSWKRYAVDFTVREGEVLVDLGCITQIDGDGSGPILIDKVELIELGGGG